VLSGAVAFPGRRSPRSRPLLPAAGSGRRTPPLDTCAVRPRPTRALDTLPRNSAERDALSAAACERAPTSPKCSVVSAVSRWASSATCRYSTPRPTCPAARDPAAPPASMQWRAPDCPGSCASSAATVRSRWADTPAFSTKAAMSAPRGDPPLTAELDDEQARRVRLLLLGKGVVSAHRIERPFAARLDESEQRPTRDTGRSVAAL
jgi:hypothetical protein